jgi:hypothetical protein
MVANKVRLAFRPVFRQPSLKTVRERANHGFVSAPDRLCEGVNDCSKSIKKVAHWFFCLGRPCS